MEEQITELIPDWCNENFDVELAQNVDEYERKNRFATLSEKNPNRNDKIDIIQIDFVFPCVHVV